MGEFEKHYVRTEYWSTKTIDFKYIEQAKQEFPKCEECKWYKHKCELFTCDDYHCPRQEWFQKWFGE